MLGLRVTGRRGFASGGVIGWLYTRVRMCAGPGRDELRMIPPDEIRTQGVPADPAR